MAVIGVLAFSSVAGAKAGWRPGLSLNVQATIAMEVRTTGQPSRQAAAEVSYRLKTAKEGMGFKVSIADCVLRKAEGDPELTSEVLKDVVFFGSSPTFRVGEDGAFAGALDVEATLDRLRAGLAAEPRLAKFGHLMVVRPEVLGLWLKELWDSWRVASGSVVYDVPLADGFVAKAKLVDNRTVDAPCPRSRMRCQQRIRVLRVGDEETRQHIETVLHANGSPNTSLQSYAQEIRFGPDHRAG